MKKLFKKYGYELAFVITSIVLINGWGFVEAVKNIFEIVFFISN